MSKPPPIDFSHLGGTLLIDDHSFVLNATSLMLRRHGFKSIFTADCAQAARNMLATHGADIELLICDLNMPGEDGMELLRWLAETGFKGGIVLFSSVEPSILRAAQTVGRSRSLNILGYVEKPMSIEHLAKLLQGFQKESTGIRSKRPTPGFSLEDLDDALNAGGLQAWFQPQVSSKDGVLTGFEALARLVHPSKGMFGLMYLFRLPSNMGVFGVLPMALANRRYASWPCGNALAQISPHRLIFLRKCLTICITQTACKHSVNNLISHLSKWSSN